MKERRKATRIKYRCEVTLSLENGISINGQVRDLSLRGAYITVGDLSLFQEGDRCGFQIRFSGVDDKITVTGAAKIARKETEYPDRKGLGHTPKENDWGTGRQSLAICFLGVDTDDLEHLRRIIALNFGDTGKIDKELQAFTEETVPQEKR